MPQNHILWIMTDQHKFSGLSATGGPAGLTPHLDALAADGYLFENCYTPSPVCGPARAAMKTGCYPPSCGMVTNWTEFRPGTHFLMERLLERGYATGMAGKLHFFPPDRPYGFQYKALSDAPYSVYANDDQYSDYIRWLRQTSFDAKGVDPVALFDADESAFSTNIRQFMMGSAFRTVQEHETAWTTDRAIEYLRGVDRDKPFFCYTSYFGPHQPYDPPEPYHSWYDWRKVQLPESYYHDLMAGHPIFAATCQNLRSRLQRELTEEDVKQIVAAYYGQIRMIDDAIGRLLDYLKEAGLYDSTTILFTSDHGDHMADYGIFFKGEMYDSCCKVPLIIKPAGARGLHRRKSQVVNTLDLYGLVLDLAGDTSWREPHIEARSLLGLLQQADSGWENQTFSVFGKDRDRMLCMLRRDQYKLIRLAQGPQEALYELYDLQANPQETVDLYGEPALGPVVAALQPVLDSWFQKQYALYPPQPALHNKRDTLSQAKGGGR